MKSILHNKKDHTCFLCMLLNNDDHWQQYLEEHHVIFGTANRRLSERYGLKVYLCPDHHRTGAMAVHRNAEVAEILIKAAQIAFMKKYSFDQFISIFGRNYLSENDLPPKKEEKGEGFEMIPDPLNGLDW